MRLLQRYLFASLCLCACAPGDEGSFEIESGFTITQVASEPLVMDPVDLEFNESGDALVLEMPGYPFEDRQSRIVVLRDRDSDGIYDEQQVVIEGLQLASSIMPFQKGILVAAPPYLLFVRDENQDDVPEGVDTLMGGFSTGNLQHNYNGLTYGLDHWIYAANGGNDGAPYWWNDTTTRLDLQGQDFRFHLESRTIERLGESSGGFELAMDEYGRLFETHNMEHVSHLVFPSRYLDGTPLLIEHTLENISDHEENGTARIYPIGEQEARLNHPEQSGYFSGACGIMYYGGGGFGPEYNQTIWVADVVLNLVHVDKLSPSGASFRASRQMEQRDFLASSDRSFRPVNMTVGPDGCIYLLDMHRSVIEHPEWIPDDIESTLDLDDGKGQGRIYRISRNDHNSTVDFTQFTQIDGLIRSLSHQNQWVRNTAHRLLIEHDEIEAIAAALQQLLRGDNDHAKLHAFHLLARAEALTEQDMVSLLSTETPALQEVVLRTIEDSVALNPRLARACVQLLKHDDWRLRMQAGLTLSRMNQEEDAYLQLAPSLYDALKTACEFEQDPWTIAAITLAAQDQSVELFRDLATSSLSVSGPMMASLAIRAGETERGIQTVLNSLAASEMPLDRQKLILRHLTPYADPSLAAELEAVIDLLEQSGTIDLLPELAALRKQLALPPSELFLAYTQSAPLHILNTDLPDSLRIQQLELMALVPFSVKEELLYACLAHHQPMRMQEEALRQLSSYADHAIGERVVAMWNELGPHIRRYASDMLIYMEVHHEALLTGLETGIINIGEMNFDLERRRELLWWTDDEEIKQRAGRLFSDAGVTNRREAIEHMKPALKLAGSTASGKEVYESVCSSCHRYDLLGKEVGPALTDIGRKSKETLLHDILDPNAATDPQYISHRLETVSGQIHIGMVASETDQTITIRKMGGERVRVYKEEVASLRSNGTSLMMEGLENSITHQQMADLLAFLQHGHES